MIAGVARPRKKTARARKRRRAQWVHTNCLDRIQHPGLATVQRAVSRQLRCGVRRLPQRHPRPCDKTFRHHLLQPVFLPPNPCSGRVKRTQRTRGGPFGQRRRRQAAEPGAQAHGIRPVPPFRAMEPRQGPDRNPWHAQRIGDDHAVQRLAQQQLAAADRLQDHERRVARIDQTHAGQRRHLSPRPPGHALEVRHEPDVGPAGRGQAEGLGHQ
jgi:hypothetical protein